MERRQTWIVVGALGVVGLLLCALLAMIIVGTGAALAGLAFRPATQTPAATSTSSPSAPPPTSTAQPATPTPTQVLGLSPEVRNQMEAIEGQIIQLRGLRPSRPVERALMTPEQLRERVIEDFLGDYDAEEAEADARLLEILGLLPPSFDLRSFYIDLYSEQIAGFYDSEADEMVIVQERAFKGPQRLTYAHEFTHVLQDQTYDLEGGLNLTETACEGQSERCAAVKSLVEGDATLVEEQWLRTFATSKDWEQILAFYESFESPTFEGAPEFIQEDFLFPYTFGARFVRQAYTEGGWPAVDALYAQPPLSTEQILHPERYPQDHPIELELPDLVATLVSGWAEFDRGVLGEWSLRQVLAAQLGVERAQTGAEGWGGDMYAALIDEGTGATAFISIIAWDDLAEAGEFAEVFQAYADARFGGARSTATALTWQGESQHASFLRAGNQTLWILAPDALTLAELQDRLDLPLPQQ